MTLNITPYEYSIGITSDNGDALLLEEADQRQILAWFAREKPEMVREAMGVDKVIEELEQRLARSKKDVQGFTDHEAAHTDGKEAGLEQAIALLKGGGWDDDKSNQVTIFRDVR